MNHVQQNKQQVDRNIDNALQDSSFNCEEFSFVDLEQISETPQFEFSSPISSISSNCSSPEIQKNFTLNEDDTYINDSHEFISLDELRSQISLPSDEEFRPSSATLVRKSILETIYEDQYLETPPSFKKKTLSFENDKCRQRLFPVERSSREEFKENVELNQNESHKFF